MNNENIGGVHRSFWAIGAVVLIWNVMGCINFFMQMNPDALADYPEAVRSLVEGRPGWARRPAPPRHRTTTIHKVTVATLMQISNLIDILGPTCLNFERQQLGTMPLSYFHR